MIPSINYETKLHNINMNRKILLPSLLSVFSLGIGLLSASCNKDEPGQQLTQTETYTVMNIYAPSDGGEGGASISKYRMSFDLLAAKLSIQSASLAVGGSTLSFETSDIPFESWLEQDKYAVNTISVHGHVPMVSVGVKMENLSMYLTNGIFDLKRPAPGVTNDYGSPIGLFMQYDLNSQYKVKTLPVDITYCGSTVTSYPSEDGMQAYQNGDIKYRIVFNVDKNTADVVMYDAKFAPPAPALKGLVLRNLDVTYTPSAGFSVSGKDIEPETFEGTGTSTPNSRYVFNSFEIHSSSADLTRVQCDYVVATVFKGTFEGSALCKDNNVN